jgi:hypothetical protein
LIADRPVRKATVPYLEAVSMKFVIQAVIAAVVLTAVPVATFSQENQPVTGTRVRADLIHVENASFNPSEGRDPWYRTDIRASEATAAAQNGARDVGDASSGTFDAGGPTSLKAVWSANYSHH